MYEPHTLVCTLTGRAIPLAMQQLDLSGRILPVGAIIRVTHKFRCENSDPMEALYVSMLPRGAALRRFKIKGKGFSVESTLKKREKARKDYEKGVDKGHLSSLAEVNQDGLVTLAVGQVRPGETISVVLEIVAGVEMSDRGLRFRYPFTVAQSYRSRASVCQRRWRWDNVSDDLIMPNWKNAGNLHQVSFGLKIDGGLSVKSVSSPSHQIEVSSGKSPKVSLAGFGETPDRDLVLDVKYAKHGPVMFYDKVGQGPGPQWTAVLPTKIFPKPKKTNRKICFVLDRSGSMSGLPMEQAKKGLLACLSALGPKDKFGLISFNYNPQSMSNRLMRAGRRARTEARAFVQGIHASGGTELYSALTEACDLVGKKGEIFLFTDGEVWGTHEILNRIAKEGIRVHVLGIGDASQDRFLAKLAADTKGVSRMVGPRENVGGKALELFSSVRKPVLHKATATCLERQQKLGRVWADHPVVLRDDWGVPLKTVIRARNLEAPLVVEFDDKIEVPEGVLGLLWAAKEIESLEIKDSKKASKKLRALGKTFGLASREMSLVAVVKRKGDKARPMVQEVVPVGTPVGTPQMATSVYFMHTLGAPQPAPSVRKRSFINTAQPMWAHKGSVTRGYSGTYSCNVSVSNTSASSETFSKGVDTLGLNYEADNSLLEFHDASPRGFDIPPQVTTTVTDSLLVHLGELEADGGMPGESQEERLLNTIMLGLVALQENPALYSAHLERMAEYLESQISNFSGLKSQVIQEVVDKFRQGITVSGSWALNMRPTPQLWTTISSAL